jgi:hypothetical protein
VVGSLVHAITIALVHAIVEQIVAFVKMLARYDSFLTISQPISILTAFSRYAVSTLAVLSNVTSHAPHALRPAFGLASIKAAVRCHAQPLAIDCLVMNDAPNFFHAIISVQVSAGRSARLSTARSAV